jgi:exoribonuclease-2
LAAQLKLQDEAAQALRKQRHSLGALEFDRVEAQPVIANGEIKGIEASRRNRASDLIEDFMIAANEVMAQTLARYQMCNIRRVVKSPERWPRIADIAAQKGVMLPGQPDSAALAAFLRDQKQKDPVHYPDLSLAIVKLMGPGQYVLSRPGDTQDGHFGLAAHDYTHSTAPNRRFADLVTQRLIKAALAREPSPYSEDQLSAIAQNCTEKEDAARKVERTMSKRVAAVAYHDRRGQTFGAVVTGVTPRGVFVRVTHPPIEGRLMRGEHGVDVGDQIRVTLINTDPQQGYIDFARNGASD